MIFRDHPVNFVGNGFCENVDVTLLICHLMTCDKVIKVQAIIT